MIVTATSGDTGKAALDGFSDVPHTGVCVFYPRGKVSDIQRLRWSRKLAATIAVRHSQRFGRRGQEVKAQYFSDRSLIGCLSARSSSALERRSINVGALPPQVTYSLRLLRAALFGRAPSPEGRRGYLRCPHERCGDVLAGLCKAHGSARAQAGRGEHGDVSRTSSPRARTTSAIRL